MKITVITVCRNSATTIAATLASVAAQTHPDIEHIVVDGASTDDTLAIVEQHRSRIARVISEPDRGIYDAMNKGLRVATGEVIGFLNADDVYADSGVLARVSAIMEAEKLDALYGDVAFFSAERPDRILRRFRSARFRPDRIGWGWMPAHPTLFLKRQVFDRYGLFKTDYWIAADFELVARIFRDGNLKYRYVPEVLVRMRTGGISTAGWRHTVLLNKEVLRACRENGIDTNVLKILSKYVWKISEYWGR